jgi:hypothetical protein
MGRSKALNGSAWALARIRAHVLNHAILHSGAWHNANDALRFALAVTFVVDKKEQTLLLEWSSQVTTKVISQQFGWSIWRSALQFRQV